MPRDEAPMLRDDLVLDVEKLTVSYDRDPVLLGVDLSVARGRLVGVVGPNGAGKSTLIKAILGLLPLDAGRVRVFGQPIKKVRRRVVYVPQRSSVDWDFPVTARDVVLMGCYSKRAWWSRPSREDRTIAAEALAKMEMSEHAERPIANLSGGQQQRVFLARALAQAGDLYFMDEPFVGVDAATERAIIGMLRELRDAGRSVIVVNHDLNTARHYFDDLLLLNRERVAFGPIADVFTPELLQQAYSGRLTMLPESAKAPVAERPR